MKRVFLSNKTKSTIIQTAIEILSRGGLVIYPTETCYGVGVDATNQEAVERLLQYKERPEGKAISIAVSDRDMAEKYVEVNETAVNLYKNFLPGPVTVISNSKHNVAKGIEAEDGSLGVRMPDYPFTLELIKTFGKPITATSANMSGRKTPYTIDDILNNIPEKKRELIDLIINAGELPHNPPSTVVDTRLNNEKVLRHGAWNMEHGTKKSQTIMSHSEEETQKIGENLMKELLPELQNKSVIFALQGDLGAGKTQFAKGVARALGIKENITSPTFTIVKEYEFSHPEERSDEGSLANAKSRTSREILHSVQNDKRIMFHIDTWRMQEEKELADLGFEKMIMPGNVVVVEWMQKIHHILKNKIGQQQAIIRVIIDIQKNQRSIIVDK